MKKSMFCIALILLLLAGCGRTDNAPAMKEDAAPVAEAEKEPAEAPEESAVSTPEEPEKAAPALTLCTTEYDDYYKFSPSRELPFWYNDSIFEGLLYTETEGCIAESFSCSQDGLQWTFVLRDGVCFSDGSPVTANDVGASFDRYIENDDNPAITAAVSSWEEGADGSFVLTLNFPLDTLPGILSSPMGTVPIMNGLGLGTGPYVPERGEGKSIILRANEYYSFPPKMPSVEAIELLLFGAPEEGLRLLKSGKADGGVFGDCFPELKELEESGFTLKCSYEASFYLLFSALDVPEAANPVFRKALSRFIDLEEINETLYSGLGKVQTSLFLENSPLYIPFEDFFYDPEEGAALLAELGLATDSIVFSDIVMEYDEPVISALAAQLEKSGLTFDYTVYGPEYSFSRYSDEGQLLCPIGAAYSLYDPLNSFGLFFPPTDYSLLSGRVQSTLGDAYGPLSDRYVNANGHEELLAAGREIMKELQESFAALPFVTRPAVTAASGEIASLETYPDGQFHSFGPKLYSIKMK